jgi:hypothetical protein
MSAPENLNAPATRSAVITPSDTEPMPFTVRQLLVLTDGNLEFRLMNDVAAITIAVKAGMVIPGFVEIVGADTTATVVALGD